MTSYAYLPTFGSPALDSLPKDIYLVVDELFHLGICDAGLLSFDHTQIGYDPSEQKMENGRQYRCFEWSRGTRGCQELEGREGRGGLTMVTSSTSNVCGLTVPKRRWKRIA